MKVEILGGKGVGVRVNDELGIVQSGETINVKPAEARMLINAGKARRVKGSDDEDEEEEELAHPENEAGVLTSREPGASVRDPKPSRGRR